MAAVQDERVAAREAGENRFEGTRPNRPPTEPAREVEASERVMARAFSVDALAAAATVVLCILGLSGIFPSVLAPIAVITMACAMLIKSSGVASRLNWLVRETGNRAGSSAELQAGMSAELLAGAAGIVLGVLALIGLVPTTLSEVAVIVFGGALLLGSGETYRVSQLGPIGYGESSAAYAARMAAETAAGGASLAGIAAVVLGILAITGVHPLTLVLVALLCLGGAMLLAGAAISTRMKTAMR